MFFLSDEMPFSFDELLLFGAASGGKLVEDTATGNPLTFSTDVSKPLKSLLIPFTPIQQGTGDPSPTNVRNVVPWNGLTVWNGGKNIYDSVNYPMTDDKWVSSVNGILNDNAISGYACTVDFIPCAWLRGQKITLNHRPGKSAPGFAFYAQDETFIAGFGNNDRPKGEAWTITVPNDAFYMRFTTAKETKDETQIELGESASTYEAPHITETDISFPSPVYGGYIDLVTGEVWNEWLFVSKKWSEFILPTALGDYTRKQITITKDAVKAQSSSVGERFCNTATWKANYTEESTHYYFYQQAEGESCLAFVFLPTETDPNTVIQLACKLASPTLITTLTPQQITALVGNNTIWSDADGTMTAVYFKKA